MTKPPDRHSLLRATLVPGIYLVLLTYWWALPAFLLMVLFERISSYNIKSYYLYFDILGSTIAAAIVFQVIMAAVRWDKFNLFLKYIILGCAHVGNFFLIGAVYELCRSCGVRFEYFGGDPEGSAGMFLAPSVILYFLVGGAVVLTVFMAKSIKRFIQNRYKYRGQDE